MTTATRKPAFTAYAVTGEGKQAFWTRIGSVWPHNHGEGFNIDLHALPTDLSPENYATDKRTDSGSGFLTR